MQNKQRVLIGALLVFAFLFVSTWAIQANDAGSSYQIDWFTMDGGGTMSAVSGSYELSGTIGQPDTASSAAEPFGLQAGFWVIDSPSRTFLPVIMRP